VWDLPRRSSSTAPPASHHTTRTTPPPALAVQETTKKEKKTVKISDQKGIKTTGGKLRKGMGSESDQLLQLTGFAVHLHSCLLIRAEELIQAS
jgi:hypothetical protein